MHHETNSDRSGPAGNRHGLCRLPVLLNPAVQLAAGCLAADGGHMASVSIVPWLGAGAFALTLACGACAPSVAAPAGERPTLLIVGEDSDPEAVPRGNRVFTRM